MIFTRNLPERIYSTCGRDLEITMKPARKVSALSESKPSRVTHEYWLYAERKSGDYP